MENLMTVSEVTKALRLTGHKNKFVYELRKKGLLPSAKIGNQIVFKESDVNKFIENQFRAQNK